MLDIIPVDLLGQIAALSFAICPDGTITGTEDLVEWAAELQYAMTKLSTITETEAAMRARIAALEGQLSQTQAALRWALVSVRPWDEEDWYRDGKLTERLICRYCMMYQTGWFDNAPNTHTTACPYRKAVELAHTQTAPATEPPNGAS